MTPASRRSTSIFATMFSATFMVLLVWLVLDLSAILSDLPQDSALRLATVALNLVLGAVCGSVGFALFLTLLFGGGILTARLLGGKNHPRWWLGALIVTLPLALCLGWVVSDLTSGPDISQKPWVGLLRIGCIGLGVVVLWVSSRVVISVLAILRQEQANRAGAATLGSFALLLILSFSLADRHYFPKHYPSLHLALEVSILICAWVLGAVLARIWSRLWVSIGSVTLLLCGGWAGWAIADEKMPGADPLTREIMLNRAALIISYREPFVQWVGSAVSPRLAHLKHIRLASKIIYIAHCLSAS